MRNGLYQRLYASLMDRFSGHYEPLVTERKRALLTPLAGEVLEIGPGTGVNLPYLADGVRWRGVEPNPYMRPYLESKAARCGLETVLEIGVAEALPADDESVDAVLGTLVLCSVKDPATALLEIRRVLKPGGRFVFVEHVAAPEGTNTRRWQAAVCPIWKRVGDGCHPNRETWRWIEQAGFEDVDIDRFRLDLPIAGPHIAGVAVK
ncbi:MAG: class I SAM-dependent methyltransferase [bacterium]|nr:class I SAM-dependent methyltransferase [bacterium]